MLPEQIAVRGAAQAFDDMDELKDASAADLLKRVIARLTDMARRFA